MKDVDTKKFNSALIYLPAQQTSLVITFITYMYLHMYILKGKVTNIMTNKEKKKKDHGCKVNQYE